MCLSAVDMETILSCARLSILLHCVLCLQTFHTSALWLQVVRMFTADAKLVKKRLEDLIDREYIERDENNNNVYKYLA